MKNLIFALCCISLSTNAFAKNAPSAQEITKEIILTVEAYANSIACSGIKINPENVAVLVPYRDTEDQFRVKYAVLWSGDIGCSGGSGSVSTNIAIVRVGMGTSFVVDPLHSSPVIEFNFFDPRGCPKIVENSVDTLEIDGFDYNPSGEDPAYRPSVPVRLTVRVDKKGNWKVIGKKFPETEK